MGFNIDNYELVEDRLKKFWADYPNGRVNTDVVGKSEDGTMVIVKAELFTDIDSKIPVSSGLAQETKGVGGFANNEAWLENCESSAIGRALANWKYQGSKKPRPTQEEMKKVQQPKKKEVAQESGISPSNDVEELGNIILDMCVGNKVLAKNVWDYTVGKVKLKKDMPKSVKDYTEDNNKTFVEEAAKYLKMINDQNKEREGNTEIINDTLDILDAKITETKNKKESEKDMDFENDDWKAGKEQDPMTDSQENYLANVLIPKAIDMDLDELATEAKQYLNSGNTSKVTCSDMIKKLQKATD